MFQSETRLLKHGISIVVPVYNDRDSVPLFMAELNPVLNSLGLDYEVLFSVDPSTDGTELVIEELHRGDPRVKMIVFSRRFGQPMATLAGLDYCTGDFAVVMDVDLQDPPRLIPEFVAKWKDGFDVVCAQRRSRVGETLIKRVVSKIGYGIINRFSDVPIPKDSGDFRLIDRRVIDHLRMFPEAHGFLRGLVSLVGFKQTIVTFDRPARITGHGKYNRFTGSLRIGLNGVIAFSSALLSLSTIIGFTVAMLAFLTALSYIVMKIVGAPFPIGNPTIVVLILLLGGLQLICLGIAGQYIGRIYDETKRRPRYIIDRMIGL